MMDLDKENEIKKILPFFSIIKFYFDFDIYEGNSNFNVINFKNTTYNLFMYNI